MSPLRFRIDRSFPSPDREPPEGGWKPVCRVEDHTWKVEFECGSFSLVCIDPHTDEQRAEMEPNGCLYGCDVDSEMLGGEIGPFKLKFQTDCPKRGFNDSGSHGYGCDCDTWLEPVT